MDDDHHSIILIIIVGEIMKLVVFPLKESRCLGRVYSAVLIPSRSIWVAFPDS